MKTLNRLILTTGLASLISLVAGSAVAQERQERQDRQGRGNFDPEQFRQRAMERYRELLEVKNDDEWKIISTRIDKVLEARRDVGFGGPGRGFGRRPEGGNDQGGGDRRSRFGGEPNPEAEALQKALEAKAPADEIKTKLAKYRETRKAKETKLAQAQDELRKVLSVRQEASAVMGGLLQ